MEILYVLVALLVLVYNIYALVHNIKLRKRQKAMLKLQGFDSIVQVGAGLHQIMSDKEFEGVKPEFRVKAEEMARQQGLVIPKNLYAFAIEENADEIRSEKEILDRALIVSMVSWYATMFQDPSFDKNKNEVKKDLFAKLTQLNLIDKLTRKEKQFFDKPTLNDAIQFSWQGERLEVFMHVLGFSKELPPANKQSDVSIFQLVMDKYKTYAKILENAKLIDAQKILFLAELHYIYQWYCIERKYKNEPNNILDPGVILERYAAFCWLINKEQEWDEIEVDV